MHTTDRYRSVLKRAEQIAVRSDCQRIELEHLAVALTDSSGVAAAALKHVRKLKRVRTRLLERFSIQLPSCGLFGWLFGARAPAHSVSTADTTTELLSQACHEARALNHNYVGTEHILLSLLRTTGEVAGCFQAEDVWYDDVKAAVRSLLGQTG